MEDEDCYKRYMEESRPLCVALDHLIKTTKNTNQAKVASYIGMKQPYISDLKNGTKKGPRETWIKIAEYFDLTYDGLEELGTKLILNRLDEAQSHNFESIVNAAMSIIKEKAFCTDPGTISLEKHKSEHHHIIDRFKNHELAVKINKVLLEIEKEDEQEFLETLEDLEHKLQKIRRRKTDTDSPKKTGTDQN